MARLISLLFVTSLSLCTSVFAQSQPIAQIPVGNGPIGLEVTEDGRRAVVPLLFPANETDPNLVVIDLDRRVVEDRFRVGRRLIDAETVPKTALSKGAGPGFFALTAFGDQDFTTLVDLDDGARIRDYPVGSRPGGVNTVVTPDGTPMGISANGSSGDISVFNLETGAAIPDIPVGRDPRDAVFHPSGEFAFVAVGGDDQVAVVNIASGQVEKKVAVGNNPIALALSQDLQTAVVSNLTNNTVTILNINNPTNPTVRRTPAGGMQLPVGVQPTNVAISPDGMRAFVANSGSSFVTVVDLNTVTVDGILPVQREGASVASAVAAVSVSGDGNFLIVTERGNDALMLLYDLVNLNLNPSPKIEIPGEPRADLLLPTDPAFACPGFYIASVDRIAGADEGLFNAELLLTAGNRLLQGGLNLGAAFGDRGTLPGFVGFNIANANNEPQQVDIDITARRLEPGAGTFRVAIEVVRQNQGEIEAVFPAVARRPPFSESIVLEPGFYVVRIRSPRNGFAGAFEMALSTRFVDRNGGGFQGGVNVGGLLRDNLNGPATTGFASFCISKGQLIRLATRGQTTLGPAGAGPMAITIRDRSRQVIRTISNSPPTPPEVGFPQRPSVSNITPTIFVDDNAAPNGDGSAEAPFRSITQAVGVAAESRDVIYVLPGRYSPSRTGEVLPIGGPGPGLNKIPTRVTLIGAGSDRTIIDAEGQRGPNGENVNAVLLGSNRVRFAGFTVRNASAAGVFVNNAAYVSIDRNLFTGNSRFGIGASASRALLVHRNVLLANDETGIAVSGSTPLPAANHTHNPPSHCGDQFGSCILENISNEHRADGILVSQGGSHLILDNQTYNNGVSGIEANNGNQPGQSPFPQLTTRIEGNVAVGNGGVQLAFAGTGILVTEGAIATTIDRNVVSNNRPGGLAVFEDGIANSIQNNVVTNNAQNGLIVQKRSRADVIGGNRIETNGLSGLFVDETSVVTRASENQITDNGSCLDCEAAKAGIAVLGGSQIDQLTGANNLTGNAVGFEISNQSEVRLIQDMVVDASILSGALIREGSEVTRLLNGRISTTVSNAPALRVSDSSITLTDALIMANGGDGLAFFEGATGEINGGRFVENGGNGIAVQEGSILTVDDAEISTNGANGVLASGSSQVAVGNSEIRRNVLRGVNAGTGSTITCQSVDLGANGTGNTFGNTPGC